MILHSRKFTVNLLHSDQRGLAGTLGKSALKHSDKMAGISYSVETGDYPILQDALAWVACEVCNTTPAGDSTLIVAEIVNTGILAKGQLLTMAEAGFHHAEAVS